eukprot:Gb_04985 [translate_table: standard]
MIAGYSQNEHFYEALKLFRQMQLKGVKPNANTFTSVLPACANLAALERGLKGKEVLQLFEQMQHSGIEPNQVTLVGVLSACCHSSLMDDGWKYFDSMSEDYNITPTMEHYSFHTNAELGEQVAEHLFELNPKYPAPYVLLSNIYAAAGRQNDLQKVRKMMKDKRVKKQMGCSWIEVNKEVYAFCEGERSHPQTQQIVAELERLSGQMKEAGYAPDASFVMHDVKDQKENILRHHSEKLANTLGFINTSFCTPIWVVTNLRVCDDCHSAIKFISKIATREITVKDVNCFHHFKDGLCSCGDYLS